jgi:hypothetical protein
MKSAAAASTPAHGFPRGLLGISGKPWSVLVLVRPNAFGVCAKPTSRHRLAWGVVTVVRPRFRSWRGISLVQRAEELYDATGEYAMSLGTILIIVLIIFLLGGFSGRFGGYGYGFGHGGVGVIGIIIIVLIVLVLLGRI